jgi:hypothetical protein
MRYGSFPRYNRALEFRYRDDYERYVKDQDRGKASWQRNFWAHAMDFRTLLNRKPAENKIQKFLEEHPYMLPGFDDLHHGPFEGIVATKLPLGKSFVTDFAYIAANSQTLYFTCVEIESGRKRLFRKDGRFHRDYLDARQQITDWLFWASQHSREAIDCWGSLFNGKPASWLRVSFRGFLVFGRRDEIDDRVKQERWSAEAESLSPGLYTLTYDRLLRTNECGPHDVDNRNIAVCSYRDRRFFVNRVIS